MMITMNSKTIGEKISQLRKAKKLSQEALGEKLGVSGQAVSKWESGASMPDILLLPQLCAVLDCSTDALLGVPDTIKKKNIVAEFCAYAREVGRGAAVCDVIARLFNDVGKNYGGSNASVCPDEIRISDARGLGFVLSGKEYREACLLMKNEDIVYFLKVLTDESCLSVLKTICQTGPVTCEELCEILNLDENAVNRILLGLMKRNLIFVGSDAKGKRGYLESTNIMGFWMVLCGCQVTSCGNECGIENIWMSDK